MNIDILETELASHPDRVYVSNLLDGLRNGFDTGISPLPQISVEYDNLATAKKNSKFVLAELKKEVQKGFLIGPFRKSPFAVYRVNPLGVATRKFSKKQRLIVDCSWPHIDNNALVSDADQASLNNLISKEDFSLKYVKFDDALDVIKKFGPGCKLSKSDICDAFKIMPLRSDLVRFYGVKFQDKYFFFTKLVFGCRSSPKIFNMLSEAINYIATVNYGIPVVLHILDDFLTIDPPELEAERSLAILTHIFNRLCIPWHPVKTMGPAFTMVWLGLEIDTIAGEVRLDAQKLSQINCVIDNIIIGRAVQSVTSSPS